MAHMGRNGHATARAPLRVCVCVNAQKDYSSLLALVDPALASATLRAITAAANGSDYVIFVSRARAPGDAAFASMSPAHVLAQRTHARVAHSRDHCSPVDLCVLGSTGVQPAVRVASHVQQRTVWYGHDPRPRQIDEVLAVAARHQDPAAAALSPLGSPLTSVHSLSGFNVDPVQAVLGKASRPAPAWDDAVHGDLDAALSAVLRILHVLIDDQSASASAHPISLLHAHGPLHVIVAGFQLSTEPDITDTARVLYSSLPDCGVDMLPHGCRSLFDHTWDSRFSSATGSESVLLPTASIDSEVAIPQRAVKTSVQSDADYEPASGDVEPGLASLFLDDQDAAVVQGETSLLTVDGHGPAAAPAPTSRLQAPPIAIVAMVDGRGSPPPARPSWAPTSAKDVTTQPLLANTGRSDSVPEPENLIRTPPGANTALSVSVTAVASDGLDKHASALRGVPPLHPGPAIDRGVSVAHADGTPGGIRAAADVIRDAVIRGDGAALETALEGEWHLSQDRHLLRIACALWGGASDSALARVPFLIIDAARNATYDTIAEALGAGCRGSRLTALMWACAYGNAELVAALLALAQFAENAVSSAAAISSLATQRMPQGMLDLNSAASFEVDAGGIGTTLPVVLLRQQCTYGYSALSYAAAACSSSHVAVSNESIVEDGDAAFQKMSSAAPAPGRFGHAGSMQSSLGSVTQSALSIRLRRVALRRKGAAARSLQACSASVGAVRMLWMLARTRSCDGWTGIHHAAKGGTLPAVLNLLSAHASALHAEVMSSEERAQARAEVRAALDLVVSVRTLDGATAVHVAAFAGQPGVLVAISSACQQLHRSYTPLIAALSCTCNVGDSDLLPLDLALLNGNVTTCRILLRFGAPLSPAFAPSARRLLHYLVSVGDGPCVARLLRDASYGCVPDAALVAFHLRCTLEPECSRRYAPVNRPVHQPLFHCIRPGCSAKVCMWCSQHCNARFACWLPLSSPSHAQSLSQQCETLGVGHLLMELPISAATELASCGCLHGEPPTSGSHTLSTSTSLPTAPGASLSISRTLRSPDADNLSKELQHGRMLFKLLTLREMAFAAISPSITNVATVASVIQAISQHLSFHLQALQHTGAAEHGHITVSAPVDFGQSVLAISDFRATLLTEAVQRRASEMALELLERLHDAGVAHDALVLRDECGMTALMHAAVCGDEAFCRAAIDVAKSYQRSLMSRSITTLARRFSVTAGAAPSEQPLSVVEARDLYDVMAVHYAAATGHDAIVRLLLEASAEQGNDRVAKEDAASVPANKVAPLGRQSSLGPAARAPSTQPWVVAGVPPDMSLLQLQLLQQHRSAGGKDAGSTPERSVLDSGLHDQNLASTSASLISFTRPRQFDGAFKPLKRMMHRVMSVASPLHHRCAWCRRARLTLPSASSTAIAPTTMAIYTCQPQALDSLLTDDSARVGVDDPVAVDASGYSPYHRALLQHLVVERAFRAVTIAGIDAKEGLQALLVQGSKLMAEPTSRKFWITAPAHRIPGFDPNPRTWFSWLWAGAAVGQHRLAAAVEETVLAAAQPSLVSLISAATDRRQQRTRGSTLQPTGSASPALAAVAAATDGSSREVGAVAPASVVAAIENLDATACSAILYDTKQRLEKEAQRTAPVVDVLHRNPRVRQRRSWFACLVLMWKLLVFMPPFIVWSFMTPAAFDFKAAALSNFRSSVENVLTNSFVFDTPTQWQDWLLADMMGMNTTSRAARGLQVGPPPGGGGGSGGTPPSGAPSAPGAGGSSSGGGSSGSSSSTPGSIDTLASFHFVGEDGSSLFIPGPDALNMGESAVVGAIRIIQLRRSGTTSCGVGLSPNAPGPSVCSEIVDTSYTVSQDIQLLENISPDILTGDMASNPNIDITYVSSGVTSTERQRRAQTLQSKTDPVTGGVWASVASRALVVDFQLYHPSQQAFAVVRLYAYFPTEGVAQRTVLVRHIRPSTGRFPPSPVFSIVTSVLLVVSAIATMIRMQRILPVHGWKGYVFRHWGWVDALFVAANVAVLVYDVRNIMLLRAADIRINTPTKFYDLWNIATQLESEFDLISVLFLIMLARAAAVCTYAPVIGPTLLGVGTVLLDEYTLLFIALILAITCGVAIAMSVALNAQSLYFASPSIAFQSLFGFGFTQQMYVFSGTPQRATTFIYYVLWTLISVTFVNVWIAILSARFIEGASRRAAELWESMLTQELQIDVWNHYAQMQSNRKPNWLVRYWALLTGYPITTASSDTTAPRAPSTADVRGMQRTRTVATLRHFVTDTASPPSGAQKEAASDGLVSAVLAAVQRSIPADHGHSSLRSVVATVDRLYAANVVTKPHHSGRE